MTFTVKADGTLLIVEGAGAAWSVNNADAMVVLTAKDEPIEIAIAKQGELADGSTGPLAGAEFTLEPAEGSAFADGSSDPVALVASGEDGSIDVPSATLAAGGTYVLTETRAPAGYELIDALTFTVAADGTIELAEGAGAAWSVSETEDGMAQIAAVDEAIEGKLIKVSAASEAAEGDAEGEEGSAPAAPVTLAGAEFTLAPAEGSAFADGSSEPLTLAASGEDGLVDLPFAQLVAGGSYTLTETKAPAGYELAAPAAFTVGEDGSIALAEGADAAWSVGEDGGAAVLTAADEPVEASIAKQGELADGTTGPLAGAEFTLEPAEGSAFRRRLLRAADPGGLRRGRLRRRPVRDPGRRRHLRAD